MIPRVLWPKGAKAKAHENKILIPFGLAISTQDQSWLTPWISEITEF